MRKIKNISGSTKRGDEQSGPPPLSGRVIEEQKNYFIVDTPSGRIMATTSGGLKKQRSRVCTGDIVDITIIDTTPPPRGIISAIHTRTSYIRRPALANCSHLLCVCTLREPPLNLEALDRLLFCAHAQDMHPCIVFNKGDLIDGNDPGMAAIIGQYRAIGYPVFITSALRKEGIDELVEFCGSRISACAGLSGVGKSTLLSIIFPDLDFRIGALSDSASRGTHTTTNVTLHPLPGGGYIADTPGLAQIELPAVPEEDVVLHFPEIARCIGQCRFNNCIHDNDPGCCVSEKVDNGEIAPWRREHYLKIYGEMMERRKAYR